MACRSGCKTQDHESYAACLQGMPPADRRFLTSPLRSMYDKTKDDLSAYRNARANGIQPETTTVEKVRQAEAASRLLGRPYNAEGPAGPADRDAHRAVRELEGVTDVHIRCSDRFHPALPATASPRPKRMRRT